MKNPLRKRLFRELRSELGKYLVIFCLMVMSIGLVSGFLVADNSMIIAYQEGFEKYKIEDGNFQCANHIYSPQMKEIEALNIKIYENFYVEEQISGGSKVRIFENREKVNLLCLMKGRLPEGEHEIALDRMYAENNGWKIGDRIHSESGKEEWKIVGLVALPDYSCLFENNNDSMFDSQLFGVAIVSEHTFEGFSKKNIKYRYSWTYNNKPEDEKEEKEQSEELMKKIGKIVALEDFIPRYLNRAITFTGEDMGSDKSMMITLLYIIIAMLAFVFAITISNTIEKEANVIGTLLASGYTKQELIYHYMEMPCLVTLIGAVIGNILGYSWMKDLCASLYYGSYSLPTYVTIWNGEAFLLTTCIPLLLMFVINHGILRRKLSLSPLKFIRRDLSRKKNQKMITLNTCIPFLIRFRIRIIFQNMGNYLMLFLGILFANLLLMFGLTLPSILDHYSIEIKNGMLSNYQYMLQLPVSEINQKSELKTMLNMMWFQWEVETENETAEKFSATSLNTIGGKPDSEEIIVYGVQKDSRYVSLDAISDNASARETYVSSSYAEKYKIKVGDILVLDEKYEEESYEFRIVGIYSYSGSLCLFMDQKAFNDMFDQESDCFSGYFSDTKITDINEKYIGSVIDEDALTKISRQLNRSMGEMMKLVDVFAVIIFMILIYLLSKIIIEKNAQSISMAKILGYDEQEVARLYIMTTSLAVVAFIAISLPLEGKIMYFLFRNMMMTKMSGWISFYLDPMIYLQMFFSGLVAYALVAWFEYQKIKKIPMEEALKNVL